MPPDEFPDEHAQNRPTIPSSFRPPRTTAALDPPTASSSTADASSSPLRPPAAHSDPYWRRSRGAEGSHAGADRWWTFTLPSKYMDKVQDYVSVGSQSHPGEGEPKGKERDEGGGDAESQTGDARSSKERKGFQRSMMSMGTRLAPPNIFATHQDQVSCGFRLDDDDDDAHPTPTAGLLA